MENMDKGLINRPKIPQIPHNFLLNLSTQAQKFVIFKSKLYLGP